MKVELFITRRLAFSPGKSFSRFVVRIAIAAVALSLAVMITSISMVNGFQNEISGKIFVLEVPLTFDIKTGKKGESAI